jgi:beta-lactamase regulating signal transducer with metallopeptidase domain
VTPVLFLAGAAAALELLVRATLLIGGAWAAAAALRAIGLSAAARHMAWLLGIAALLALPLLWWLAPALRLPILPEAAAASAPSAAPLSAFAPSAFAPPLPGQWAGLLLLAWAFVAAFLLLRIAVARRVLARVWREAEPAPEPAWEQLLFSLSLEMRLPRPVELRIAGGPAMPMTWGTLAPRILLPAEARTWSHGRRRLVLLHELAHVARRDSLSRSVASLACALYWFHPGAWFAARRMFMEQEHAADDRVLAAGGSARAYARSLLHLATPAGDGFRPAHAAGMAGMYQLERRLVSIIEPARRDRPTRAFLSSSALLASLATLVVAAGVPVGFSSARPGPDPASFAANEAVTELRARSAAPLAAGPRDVAAVRTDAGGLAEQDALRRDPAFARSISEGGRTRPGYAAPPGVGGSASPAPPTEPAAAGGAIARNPDAAMIRIRPEAFTLSQASMPAGGLAARPPLRQASNGPAAFPDPTENVARSFSASARERSRRAQSERRTRFVLEVVRGVPIEL